MFDSIVGITARNWIQLAKENHFRFGSSYLSQVFKISLMSVFNSSAQKKEIEEFGGKVKETKITTDPVFLLGHWRSGTTFLHNLISLDQQFTYPKFFEIQKPHIFLHLGEKYKHLLENPPKEKRIMDNVQVSLLSPSEEEFAIAIMSLKSPLIGWIFPKRAEYYDRYLTFLDVDPAEIEQWKNTLMLFLKKLTYKCNKPLLLKSPTNTGRIPLLLEMFPKAKFVHIHRDPCQVFRSTKKLYQTAVEASQLQTPDNPEVDDYIIGRYKIMYDVFFETYKLIPSNQYIEVAFEDLENDSLSTVENIYDKLALPGFDQMKPELENYIREHSNYKKNNYNEIDPALRKKIKNEWRRSFEEWGYEI